MKRKGLRFISICVILMLVMALFAGCAKSSDQDKQADTTTTKAGAVEETGYWDMLGDVDDSSDLPDWTGKQLSLSVWYGHGSGSADHPEATEDVVSPEIKRVTGVELNAETSFDNGGSTIDVKMALLSAANDWPDLIYQSSTDMLRPMVMAGKLYDLTELAYEYAPETMSKFDPEVFPKIKEKLTADTTGISDRYYFLPAYAGKNFSRILNSSKPEFDATKWSQVQFPRPMIDWERIWVRDDILKKMYPTAKTQDEIEALFAKNGTFTREEIYDVPIKSYEDFLQFMRDMKKLIDAEDIRENNIPVEVSYAGQGGDNWGLMKCLLGDIIGTPGTTNNYFTYFDKEQDKVVYTTAQEWFKEAVRDLQKLVAEGVLSPESLIDDGAVFSEKLNGGHYAIAYAWNKPDETALKDAGKTFRYRFVWPDIKYNFTRWAAVAGAESVGYGLGIFKDSVSEEDLPQVIRYLNYMMSDIGEKLISWGPKSAGLFTESSDGARKYVDKDLENNMAFGDDNGKSIYYGLTNMFLANEAKRSAWPYRMNASEAGLFHPKYLYAGTKPDVSATNNYFQPGLLPGNALEDFITPLTTSADMWSYSKPWELMTKGRDAFEKALMATLAAKDDASFDALWQKLQDVRNEIGCDDKVLADINAAFDKANPNFHEDVKKIK